MKKVLFLICLLALLPGTGCEKVIEFKGETTQPRLTLAAQASVGEPLVAYVASSIFFLDHDGGGRAFKDPLDTVRGQVRCYVNGSRIGEAMRLSDGYEASSLCYVSDYVPAPGDHIRLEAEFPDFDPVWAETSVPRLPEFDLISVERRQDAVDLTLAVTDDGSYDKYYFLQPFAGYGLSWEGSQDTVMRSLDFTSSDIIFRNVGGSALQAFKTDPENAVASNFFSDALIKGERYVFKITVPLVQRPDEIIKFALKLAAVDENLYWYDYAYTQLRQSFGGLFSEAVTLYSNVHGGYGILCSVAPSWLDVEW